MASTKEYLDFIMGQLSNLEEISKKIFIEPTLLMDKKL